MAAKKSIDSLVFLFVAGGSCSGKSHLSDALKKRFGHTLIIRQDWYYKNIQFQEDDRLERFEAFDVPLLIEDIHKIIKGETLYFPTYSYKLHRRINLKRPVNINPRLVIVEGLYAIKIGNEAGREGWFDRFPTLKIFVDVAEETMLNRRRERDITRTHQTKEEIISQMTRWVIPAYRKYIVQQKDHADIIFNNDTINGPIKMKRALGKILEFIEKNGDTKRLLIGGP
jgi:uridine kinase